MKKKKSSLALYRKKGWKRARTETNTPKQIVKRFCRSNSVSPSKVRKRNMVSTPVGRSVMKRRYQATFSPLNLGTTISTSAEALIVTPVKYQRTPDSVTKSKKQLFVSDQVLNACDQRCDNVNLISIEQNVQHDSFCVINNTSENIHRDVTEAITLLNKLVSEGKFSTDNISFQLFLDSLRWHSSNNTSGMRYSNATKEFFWTGQRLLGGQFLRFMRGFAHHGQVKEGKSEKGAYDPSTSEINLPVPSDAALSEFTPSGFSFEDNLQPGIINRNIVMASNAMPATSHVIMFDGKKITPNSAEIFLLDKEEEPTFAKLNADQQEKIKCIENLMTTVEACVNNGIQLVDPVNLPNVHDFLKQSKDVIHVIGKTTRSLRECYCKKVLYLEKLQKKILVSNEEKLKYACDRLRTLLYKIKVCLNDLLGVIDALCQFCAELNGVREDYMKDSCDLTRHGKYKELKNPEDVKSVLNTDTLPEMYTKQRSPEWFTLREKVKVTGSVAHKALGLETLAAQKEHFAAVFGDTERPEPCEQQKRAMAHGSLNEVNAIATLISKIMPVYYPNHCFYEEGAYSIKNDSGQPLIIVSPDGSLRNETSLISIEIKCPFTTYTGMTPVYYEVKNRHVVQCCLETEVLKATEHIYISWNTESTTVFKMKPNPNLVKSIVNETEKLYYDEYPAVPTKVSETAKRMKEDLLKELKTAEYLGEFKSVHAYSSPRATDNSKSRTDIYYNQEKRATYLCNPPLNFETVLQHLHKGVKEMTTAYEYQKPMASEVLVYLISDMDRTWHREIGHGLPVAYLYKGYSLSMSTAQNILDEVLDECYRSEAHVPCVCFDGQFARLKDYDENDIPHTLFALQRRFWAEVQGLKKNQLISSISDMFVPEYSLNQEGHVIEGESTIIIDRKYFVVTNKDKKILPVVTSVRAFKGATSTKEQNTTDTGHEQVDLAGLEEDVVSIIQEIESDSVEASEQLQNQEEACTEGTPNRPQNDTSASATINTKSNMQKPCTQETSFRPQIDTSTPSTKEPDSQELCTPGTSTQIQNDTSAPVTDDTNQQEQDTTRKQNQIELKQHDYEMLKRILENTKRKSKWTDIDVEGLQEIFSSGEKMQKEFTGNELSEIVKYLNLKLKKSKNTIHQSIRKAEKVNAICTVIGNTSRVNIPLKQTRKKTARLLPLKVLCMNELKKKSYSKDGLAESYAKSTWPKYRDKWFDRTANVEQSVDIEFCDEDDNEKCHYDFNPVYSPMYSKKRNQLEVRVQDGTHIRTNIKSKLIRQGLEDIKVTAWKKVAASGKTALVPAMLEMRRDGKIMHQQSDPFVRTMFSEEVEESMVSNGDISEARFCRLFREWHEADDSAGLSAKDRCMRSLHLREWLLDGYDFGNFPPPSMYVRGIPRTTYEGLVCNIDAHLLLYYLVKGGTYCWRSVSTLVAENFMGELAERAQNNHGVPSGRTLPMEMKKISELHCMRLNPNRSFQMKTSKSRAYEVPEDISVRSKITTEQPIGEDPFHEPSQLLNENLFDGDGSRDDTDRLCTDVSKIQNIYVRNHEFDVRKGSKGKRGQIGKWMQEPKGVQPVRVHYRVDESKIKPSILAGITEDDMSFLGIL